MQARASNNLSDVARNLRGLLPSRPHRAQLRNSLEYAHPLHDKHGYYVFNPQHFAGVVRSGLAAALAARGRLDDRTVTFALEAACIEELNFLRSKTGELRPPAKRNAAGGYLPAGERGGKREARAGGWADITGNLAAAYSHDVD